MHTNIHKETQNTERNAPLSVRIRCIIIHTGFDRIKRPHHVDLAGSFTGGRLPLLPSAPCRIHVTEMFRKRRYISVYIRE